MQHTASKISSNFRTSCTSKVRRAVLGFFHSHRQLPLDIIQGLLEVRCHILLRLRKPPLSAFVTGSMLKAKQREIATPQFHQDQLGNSCQTGPKAPQAAFSKENYFWTFFRTAPSPFFVPPSPPLWPPKVQPLALAPLWAIDSSASLRWRRCCSSASCRLFAWPQRRKATKATKARGAAQVWGGSSETVNVCVFVFWMPSSASLKGRPKGKSGNLGGRRSPVKRHPRDSLLLVGNLDWEVYDHPYQQIKGIEHDTDVAAYLDEQLPFEQTSSEPCQGKGGGAEKRSKRKKLKA